VVLPYASFINSKPYFLNPNYQPSVAFLLLALNITCHRLQPLLSKMAPPRGDDKLFMCLLRTIWFFLFFWAFKRCIICASHRNFMICSLLTDSLLWLLLLLFVYFTFELYVMLFLNHNIFSPVLWRMLIFLFLMRIL